MCLLFGTQAMFDHDKMAYAAMVMAIRAGYQDKADYELKLKQLLKANEETLEIPLLLTHLKHLTMVWLNLVVREDLVRFDALYNKFQLFPETSDIRDILNVSMMELMECPVLRGSIVDDTGSQ